VRENVGEVVNLLRGFIFGIEAFGMFSDLRHDLRNIFDGRKYKSVLGLWFRRIDEG
jgi:hypothetical protein